MNAVDPVRVVAQNALVASLPRAEGERLRARSRCVLLSRGALAGAPLDDLEHVYFPVGSVVATVSTMRDGATAEVGLAGREGAVGLPALFGERAAELRGVVLVAGSALRVSVDDCRECLAECETLARLLQQYMRTLLVQIAQTAACNGLHSVEQRVARWLLVASDRACSTELPLTQETISSMLGARRAGVGSAMSAFQRAGLVHFSRGRIAILDAAGLERAGCECYGVVRRAFDRAPCEPRFDAWAYSLAG